MVSSSLRMAIRWCMPALAHTPPISGKANTRPRSIFPCHVAGERRARLWNTFWTQVLGQRPADPFHIPFVDYARGDGMKIGPGHSTQLGSDPDRCQRALGQPVPRAVGFVRQGSHLRRERAGRTDVQPRRLAPQRLVRPARLCRPGQGASAARGLAAAREEPQPRSAAVRQRSNTLIPEKAGELAIAGHPSSRAWKAIPIWQSSIWPCSAGWRRWQKRCAACAVNTPRTTPCWRASRPACSARSAACGTMHAPTSGIWPCPARPSRTGLTASVKPGLLSA